MLCILCLLDYHSHVPCYLYCARIAAYVELAKLVTCEVRLGCCQKELPIVYCVWYSWFPAQPWDGWAQIQLECCTLDLLSLPLCSLLSLPFASSFAPCLSHIDVWQTLLLAAGYVIKYMCCVCAVMCWAHLIKPQKQWHKCQAAAGFVFSLTIRVRSK